MQTTFSQAPSPARVPPASTHFDQEFIELLDAYRPSGGILRGDSLLDRFGLDDFSALHRLARDIASQNLLSFRWGGSIWLPVFQLDVSLLQPRVEVGHVLRELGDVWDGWEIARWFITADASLDGASPLAMLYERPEDVRDAARASRFVYKG